MPLASERWTPSTNPAKTLPYLALHSRMKELANIRYWRLPSQLVVSVHCVPRITKAKAAKIVMFCFLELDDFFLREDPVGDVGDFCDEELRALLDGLLQGAAAACELLEVL